MWSESEPSSLTPSQRAGLGIRRVDQDRTLEAIHRLEDALGAAAPGRELIWQRDVLAALTTLNDATLEERHNADEPDSLLSDISRTQPRLRNRVRGLRAQYRQLCEAIDSLREEVAASPRDSNPDFSDLRQRLAWLLAALRHQRSRESDLIYEAYYDAYQIDIGTEGAS
jgi:hypothetical protein